MPIPVVGQNAGVDELLRSLARGVVVGALVSLLALAVVLVRSVMGGAVFPARGALAFPVPDAPSRELRGSFHEPRGDRLHAAVDIPAPRGARVVAVSDGTVARLGEGGNAGLSIDLLADGYCFFYAHLEALSPGLSEGARVERGETLGTVGTSGNAAAAAPHLHFAVRRLTGAQDCWAGEPVDPAPLLPGDP